MEFSKTSYDSDCFSLPVNGAIERLDYIRNVSPFGNNASSPSLHLGFLSIASSSHYAGVSSSLLSAPSISSSGCCVLTTRLMSIQSCMHTIHGASTSMVPSVTRQQWLPSMWLNTQLPLCSHLWGDTPTTPHLSILVNHEWTWLPDCRSAATRMVLRYDRVQPQCGDHSHRVLVCE